MKITQPPHPCGVVQPGEAVLQKSSGFPPDYSHPALPFMASRSTGWSCAPESSGFTHFLLSYTSNKSENVLRFSNRGASLYDGQPLSQHLCIMSTIANTLTSMEMLHEDMVDECNLVKEDPNPSVTERFLRLLGQYKLASEAFESMAEEFTELGFMEYVTQQHSCIHLVNKKVLLVQNKLLGYAYDYYKASQKVEGIRHTQFDEQADKKFDLLSTKAIKHKSQFRTLAKAMKRNDYESLMEGIGLPEFDWGWDRL